MAKNTMQEISDLFRRLSSALYVASLQRGHSVEAAQKGLDDIRELADALKASDPDDPWAQLAVGLAANRAEFEAWKRLTPAQQRQLEAELRAALDERRKEFTELFGEPTYPRRHPIDEKA